VGKRTILTIDGQLSGDYIEVVEIRCNQAESEGKLIDVFLHNVSAIDESGRAPLTRLAAKGVRLLAAGMWTPCVVRDLAAVGSEALTSPRGSRHWSRENKARSLSVDMDEALGVMPSGRQSW
jgi:hypothetical protein